jgi:tetratricopeptide (TPR) repeat protein
MPAATDIRQGSDDGFDSGDDGFFDALSPLLASRASEALAVASAAQILAANRGDAHGVVRAMLVAGMAHDALGQAERDSVLAEALRRAQQLGDPVLLLRATNSQVVVDIYHGRYADALVRGQAVLGLAHALGRPELLGRLLNNLATALDMIGEHAMSISIYSEWRKLLAGDSDETRLNRIRAANNEAEAWRSLAKTYDALTGFEEQAEALQRACSLAEEACGQMLAEPHISLRMSTLDTLVSVLLERGDSARAREWVDRVARVSGEHLRPGSLHWGMFALVLSRVELALPAPDLPAVLARLRAIEALPGPRFRGGEMQAALRKCLSDVLERLGEYREALTYHHWWLKFEARAQSLWAREHAMAVHHTLDSLRGETEEFITHDLRNPLGAAVVQMEAIAVQGKFEGAVEPLGVARTLVQQALDAADHYLTIVRVRNLRRSGLSTVDIAELVDDVGERLAPPSGAPIRLEREVEWGLKIRGDRISLLAALDRLLRLALGGAPARSYVGWRLTGDSGHAVLVATVEDASWAHRMLAARSGRSVLANTAFDANDITATMLSRVAQLHDSRIEILTIDGPHSCVEWRFPLNIASVE